MLAMRNGLQSRRTMTVGSFVSLIMSAVLAILARPDQPSTLRSDPRTVLCGSDCFPAANPWLLIAAAILAIAGFVGLRIALKRTR
jgi:hypothetical protein